MLGEQPQAPERTARPPSVAAIHGRPACAGNALRRQVTDPGLEAVTDLVRPEALEPNQGLVQAFEVLGADLADLLQRTHLALIQLLDNAPSLQPFVREADTHR